MEAHVSWAAAQAFLMVADDPEGWMVMKQHETEQAVFKKTTAKVGWMSAADENSWELNWLKARGK